MAAPVKRPNLSFSVEAILSMSKRMRKENDSLKEEETKGGFEESSPDSTSQTHPEEDNIQEEVFFEENDSEEKVPENDSEENVPDSTSPERFSKKEERQTKPGVIADGQVQVNPVSQIQLFCSEYLRKTRIFE